MKRNLLLAIAALAALCFSAPAWACGGFFCFTQPVDQSAERILYLQRGNQITVHIQISYKGDDTQFSWVLPLQKQPTLGIGSDSVFQVLEQFTAPSFVLDWKQKDNCNPYYGCMDKAYASGGGGPPVPGANGGVTVLAQQNVGPYETAVIQGDTGAAIVKWLNDNKFVQPKETTALIDVYVKQKYVFLALKLQKDKGTGDLAPIVITLDESSPCLPLRLTQLAAQPDMPIVAWVLGQHRAIPKNFLHVVLNEATIDWLGGASNYKTVVSKAVDQASGHAFTTEYAQATSKFQGKFLDPNWKAGDLDGITDPGKFLQALMDKGYPRTTQMQNLIRKYISKPDAYKTVSDQEFYGCIQNNGTGSPCDEYKAAVAKQPFDNVAFAKDVQDLIVAPLADIQKAFGDLPYLTRLFTTVSPEEMNKDPIFSFNPDLPDVDAQHHAQAEPICATGSSQPIQVALTMADGAPLTVDVPKDANTNCFYPGQPVSFGAGEGPVNDQGGQPAKKVQVLDETGAALDIEPTVADLVDSWLNSAAAGTPSLTAAQKGQLPPITWDARKPGGPTTEPTVKPDAGGTTPGADAKGTTAQTAGGAAKSGCNAGGTAQNGLAVLALLLLGAGVVARRRQA